MIFRIVIIYINIVIDICLFDCFNLSFNYEIIFFVFCNGVFVDLRKDEWLNLGGYNCFR